MPRSLRVILLLAVALNLLGTAVFGSAAMGRPVLPLPLSPPPFYAAQIALTIGLFGGVYGWLALQPTLNRPLLLVGALGKIGFFLLFVIFWRAGAVTGRNVADALPDLLLGTAFLFHLRRVAPTR